MDDILGTLVYDIRAQNVNLDGDLAKGEDSLKGWAAKMGNPFVAIGAAVVAVGVAVAAASIDMTAKFKTATIQMANNAGITKAAAEAIGNAFLGTALKSEFSAQDMMDAYAGVAGQLRQTEGHALTTQEALSFMTTATELATASGQDLKEVTAALSQTMQVYSIPVSQAAEASDMLYNVSRLTGSSIGEVSTAVDKLKTQLGPLAPSLQDSSAMLLDMESHGISGSRGLMALNQAMTTLMGGSAKTTDEIKNLGLNVTDANGNFVGFASLIDQLQPKLAGMTEAQRLDAEQSLFGSAATKKLDETIMAGLPGYQQATDAATQHGTAQAGAAAKSQTLEGEWKTLKSAASDLMVVIGNALTPALQQVVVWITQAIKWVMTLGPEFQAIGNVIKAVWPAVSTAIATFWTTVFNIFKSEVAIIVGIVQAFVAIISAIVTVVTNVYNAVRPIVQAIATAFVTAFNAVGQAVNWIWGVIQTVFNAIGTAITAASDVVKPIVGAIATAISAIGNAADWIWKVVKPIFDGLAAPIQAAAGLVAGPLGAIANGLNAIGNAAIFASNMVQNAAKKIADTVADPKNSIWAGALGIHATGGFFQSPHMAVVGDAPGGEWVINRVQAGGYASLLDSLVGNPGNSAPSAPTGSSVVTTAMSPINNVTINLSGVMARSRADIRSIGMDLVDAVNEQLKSQGMEQLPNRLVPL